MRYTTTRNEDMRGHGHAHRRCQWLIRLEKTVVERDFPHHQL